MAGREKKPALVKKQIVSSISQKEGESVTDSSATTKVSSIKSDAPKLDLTTQSDTNPVLKQIKKAKPKKPIKKNLKINFRAKSKATKKLKLSKSLFKTNKINLDTKNVTLLKNGLKNKKKQNIKVIRATEPNKSMTDNAQVPEENITAIPEENASVKKDTKKRVNKKTTITEDVAESSETAEKKQKLDSEVVVKEETVEDVLNDVANELQLDIDAMMKKPAKKKVTKKTVKTTETLKPEDAKPKKSTPKKTKTETVSRPKKGLKNQSLIDSFCKDITLDTAAQNVINSLDLNVSKTTANKKRTIKNRRHSIEKIPALEENQNASNFEPPFALFTTNTRRSASPKSKRNSKIRQSTDSGLSKITQKRFSPYTTRSDSPARILRNGKHRKLKDVQLLEGLDTDYKKRRRLCSEYSGSELSKSEYMSESDSSFSDLASLQENGAVDMDSPPKEENLTKSDLLKKEILESIKNQPVSSPEVNEIQNLNIKQISTKFTAILKRSLSTETSHLSDSAEDVKPKLSDININTSNFTDTNSNDVKLPEVKLEEEFEKPIKKILDETEIKTEKDNCDETDKNIVKVEKVENETETLEEKIASSPSEKVPDKSLILNQMKEKFNDEEFEKRATRSSKRNLKLEEDKNESLTPAKFYGTETASSEPQESTEENSEKTQPNEEVNTEMTKEVNTEMTKEVNTETNEEINTETTKEVNTEMPKEVNKEATDEVNIETTNDIKTETSEEKLETEPPVVTDEEKQPVQIAETNISAIESQEEMEVDPEPQNITEESETIPSSVSPTLQFEESKIDNEEESLLAKLKGNSAISISITEPKEVKASTETTIFAELNGDEPHCENKENEVENIINNNEMEKINSGAPIIEETPENLAIKENILSALGLQSLRAAEEAKLKEVTKPKPASKTDGYTGTLKTVIKLDRKSDSKKRKPLKMTLQKSKSRNLKDGDSENSKSDGSNGKNDSENSCYKVMKESSSTSSWKGSHSSDTAGANRKTHYSNRSNMDGSSEHASDGDERGQDGETSGTKALVIPEKASSFSIHPDRLCSDECAYCFGKFGLFDTPLHIAQIKSVERQNKILENEIYLMRDSCLCDACYRHVDRRLNSASSFNNKNCKRAAVFNTIPRPNNCHVIGCERESSHVLRRKWLMKMKKSVSRVINIDLDNPGLHSIPICAEHYTAVEHLMVCALCKRRLARNHVHYLGFELDQLNTALEKESIPVKLTDKPVVCKLCRYFATLLLKPTTEIKSTTASFFKQYKKRLLHFHDIEVMDEAEAEEPISVPLKDKSEKELMKKSSKKSKPSKGNTSKTAASSTEQSNNSDNHQSGDNEKHDQSRVPSNSENGESCESTPSDHMVDIETLVPNMVLECGSDTEDNTSLNKNSSEVPHHHHHNKTVYKKLQIPESVREAVEISKIMNRNRKNNIVERLGSNPSISVRQLFPGEEDLPLQGSIDFNTVKERTPEGWEKCTCTIQYDVDTKHLWQELQKPYGNQSSFLRHLILLEKYFRNGDLTLSPNASHHAVNYSVSVQNRLRAYDNIPTNSLPMQPLTMLPFNQIKKSQSGIITTNKEPPTSLSTIVNAANLPKNTPIPISQLNPNFLTQLSVRQKTPGVPPGLISLQPGTNRPVAPLIKVPQKFKLPIGKNWRPTLIPITQTKTATTQSTGEGKRITGLVQVISGGKPYHITMQDYNRMCYIKKNQEMKQKAAEAKLKQREPEIQTNSVLKPVVPRKQKTATNIIQTSTPNNNKQSTSVVNSNANKDLSPNISVETKKDSPPAALPPTTKSLMILPKIPKSLTVIPQTVARKPLQPASPTLSITTKPSTSKSS